MKKEREEDFSIGCGCGLLIGIVVGVIFMWLLYYGIANWGW